MLILDRFAQESIVIDGRIVVTFLGMKGRQAKIGIAADRDVRVNRFEVEEKFRRRKAAQEGGQS